jgi:hypothetical protein
LPYPLRRLPLPSLLLLYLYLHSHSHSHSRFHFHFHIHFVPSPPQSMPTMDDSRSATLHEEKGSRPASRDGEKSVLPSRASVTEEKEVEASAAASPRLSASEQPEHQQEIDATEVGGHDLSKIKTSLVPFRIFDGIGVFTQELLYPQTKTDPPRTTLSSPLLFPKSPTSSTVSPMLAGTVVVSSTPAQHWVSPVS